jgi:hypothetical protein
MSVTSREFCEFLNSIAVREDGSAVDIPPEQLLSFTLEAIHAYVTDPGVDMADLSEKLRTLQEAAAQARWRSAEIRTQPESGGIGGRPVRQLVDWDGEVWSVGVRFGTLNEAWP